MGKPLCYVDGAKMEVSESLTDRIYGVFSDGVHFAMPISSLRTNEADLVRGVLQILQGFSSSLFYWDHSEQRFRAKIGIYVSHLSLKSLHAILNKFLYAATCLQLVEVLVDKLETSARLLPPTLMAFSCSVSAWLKRLRHTALEEDVKISNSEMGKTPTLLGMASALSSLCSGAEYLLQIVHGAIPQEYFEPDCAVPAAQIAAHIHDHLYKKLNELCLVEGGEEEAYQMLLFIFVGSLLPYIEVLDLWLYEGTLDDPFEEMFFYANKTILVDEADFWEKSYLLRPVQYCKLDAQTSADVRVTSSNDKNEMAGKEFFCISSSVKGNEWTNKDHYVCPIFLKDIAKSIISAGKSLQLIQHISTTSSAVSGRGGDNDIDRFGSSKIASDFSPIHNWQSIAGLTLSEAFCVSLAGLIGHGDHISKYFWHDGPCNSKILPLFESNVEKQNLVKSNGENLSVLTCSEKIWCKFLVDALSQKGKIDLESAQKDANGFPDAKEKNISPCVADNLPSHQSFCPENPVITVCQTLLKQNRDSCNSLNLSRNFHLPSLNDEDLRKAIFGGKSSNTKGTNYGFGFQLGESKYLASQDDAKLLEELFPFPTLLPSFQEDLCVSELLPFQKNSTLPSRVLGWIQSAELKTTPLPVVIVQECLTIYIKKQVDYIGRNILSKLMKDWRLMDELGVLRAIYLLGSGDLLQHFLIVIFNKLDKGESWDDDFELNTILQESIRNSADGMLLSAPDSLIVSISKHQSFNSDEQHTVATVVSSHKILERSFGVDGFDFLKFTYKVSWPLELIANEEAIKKYNQVMGFLLKVKHAKYVLDKARRWIWKGRGTAPTNRKHHWLVEHKLLHFVDAFHQYVMDRVYHSAWRELCEGMAAARSLDEVIEVHDAYLLSIQRQCFVVPDKLWALIASRINSILGLALDFYSIQQTLSSSGAVSAMKARCEMEVERIEKQFDDCIAFLLRVLSFKLNVGHFPHLADLVTRINYNYFYMSASGNLIAAPGADAVSSKLGKAFLSRQ
ncbi:uncharacterized protein LOC131161533 [Malania oleifera]|uniref:uncharacterized protein LOC131161533 n=1 Tax=Malania oleifera TaxID=397392 RepID=UPI0025ADD0E0|nr:uncharacterized protein LOC131161533 [Malania oleifera]